MATQAATTWYLKGTVLIAWEHKALLEIVNALMKSDQLTPQFWPDDRFDMIWLLRSSGPVGYSFIVKNQALLDGDVRT